MIKHIIIALSFCGCLLIALASCGNEPQSGNVVHMDDYTFLASQISVGKGENILLINDSLVSAHPLQNGSWKNGAPQPRTETGAPKVETIVNGGGQATIGPFTTTGTYHIYCTAHPGMELIVIVH